MNKIHEVKSKVGDFDEGWVGVRTDVRAMIMALNYVVQSPLMAQLRFLSLKLRL